jgi:alkylated DNA repair dioxygenase AlkB
MGLLNSDILFRIFLLMKESPAKSTMTSTMTFTQSDLFPLEATSVWHLPDGSLTLIRNFLPKVLHHSLFSRLAESLEWEQTQIRMAGKLIRIPRLNAWYGDNNAVYRYSGTRFRARPWVDPLTQIRVLVEQQANRKFNSVLANLYRDGQDSVAWHADDEAELGKKPFIASLSLGQVRRFQLKHRCDKSVSRIDIDLPDNSLLLMGGSLQHHWIHQVPKTRKVVGPRINLTFRWVQPG